MSRCVVLVGPPGAGKSTLGRLLARRLGVSFRETDEDIVRIAGRSIADIFTRDGEEVFRAMEAEAVAAALAEHQGVLSLGGGAILSERTRGLLAEHHVVFLSVGLAEGAKRVGLSTARPLLTGVNPRATFKALLEARLPLYREVSTVEISTDEHSPDQLVEQLVRWVGAVSGTSSSARS